MYRRSKLFSFVKAICSKLWQIVVIWRRIFLFRIVSGQILPKREHLPILVVGSALNSYIDDGHNSKSALVYSRPWCVYRWSGSVLPAFLAIFS